MRRRRRAREQGSFIQAQKRLLGELKGKGWTIEGDTASRSPGSVERIRIEPRLTGAVSYWGPVRATRVALGHSSDGWVDIRKISADDILRWVAEEGRIEYQSMREAGKMPSMHLSEAARRRGGRPGQHSVPAVAFGDTRLSTWEERDRAHVELINAKNDASIVEWWDNDVRQAIEDGFLDPRKLHQSAYDYAVHIGLIQRPGERENPVFPDYRPLQHEDIQRYMERWAKTRGWTYVPNSAVPMAEGLWQFHVVKVEGRPAQMMRISHKQLVQSASENPVQARDFGYPAAALKAAVEKYGAVYATWEELEKPNRAGAVGVVHVYTPKGKSADGWVERKLEYRKGLWHWPRDGKTVKKLPANVDTIEQILHREEHPEARECACEHCGAKENPVEVSDGIPWVKTERNAEDFEEVRAVAQKVGEIKNSRDIYKLMEPWASRQDKEHLCVVLLDIHSMLRGVAVIHIGTRDRVTVDPADVLKPAIDRGAKGLAILHNHPTGSAQHSDADASLTRAIAKACKSSDIAFIDHVVMGSGEYYSFADKKLHKVRSR